VVVCPFAFLDWKTGRCLGLGWGWGWDWGGLMIWMMLVLVVQVRVDGWETERT
jgi:hypothetical protein